MAVFGVENREWLLTGLVLAALVNAAPALADDRSSIAVFRDWGAFRTGSADAPDHCYAVAEPPPGTSNAGRGAFASVGSWPAQRIRAQLAIHLSHDHRENAPVTLSIGDSAYPLVVRDRDAWAQNRHVDAVIVSAMRSGSSMSVSSVAPDGTPFADAYRLRGAASAIDSALLACPLRR
jgi:hypothetical protein